MFKIIIDRLMHLGEIPICNGNASRALHIGDFCFFLCYRCSGVVIGLLISLYYLKKSQPNIKYMILIFPLIIDGFLQLLTMYESTNLLRLITGILFGIGITQGIIYLSNIIYDAV